MRRFTETKAFAKTSEFFVWALAVSATLIATYADNDDALHNDNGWLYVAILSAAYIVSRGLAKSGTRASPTRSTASSTDRWWASAASWWRAFCAWSSSST